MRVLYETTELGGAAAALQAGRGKLAAAMRLLRAPSLEAVAETRRGRAFVGRYFGMDAARVLSVVDALGEAGVDWWIAGGWGVDALLGRETRRHCDLDVVVDARQAEPEVLAAALQPLGFRLIGTHSSQGPARRTRWSRLIGTHSSQGPALHTRWLFGTRRGRRLDVLPVDPGEPPFDVAAFARGTIRGRAVGCLSVAAQQAAHEGYEKLAHEVQDLEALGTVT